MLQRKRQLDNAFSQLIEKHSDQDFEVIAPQPPVGTCPREHLNQFFLI